MQLDGRTLLCFVDAQLSPLSGAALVARGVSLHLPYQVHNIPFVHLGLRSHGLEPLRRLAHVKPLDLGVDPVQLLRRVSVGGRGRERAEALEVHLEAAVVEIGAGAAGAPVRSFSAVEAFVELEVDELREAGRAELALIRPLA